MIASAPDLVAAQPGRHAVILCHPDPGSFDHSIARTYCQAVHDCGQTTVLRDLYAIGFDPVLKADERPTLPNPVRTADVQAELDAIAGSDIFVLIYPIWFGTAPAMMKGYIERVLGSGVRPEAIVKQAQTSLLGGKRLLNITTSGTTDIWLNEQGQEEGLRSVFDQYLTHAFGMHSQEHLRFDHITSALSQRFADQYFLDVVDKAERACALIAFGDTAVHDNPNIARQWLQHTSA